MSLRKYRETKFVVLLIGITHMLDYHSTFLVFTKYGVYGRIREFNRVFWFFIRLGVSYPYALMCSVMIGFALSLGYLFVASTFLYRYEAWIYYFLFIFIGILVLVNNYSVYLTGFSVLTDLVITLSCLVVIVLFIHAIIRRVISGRNDKNSN